MNRILFVFLFRKFWFLLSSIFLYNLNKYYLRFLSMELQWYRLLTDVLPNFLIILIAYSILSLLKSASILNAYKRTYDYIALFTFGLILTIEEYSGIFGMSRVTDLNDSLASFSAVIAVIISSEINLRRE